MKDWVRPILSVIWAFGFFGTFGAFMYLGYMGYEMGDTIQRMLDLMIGALIATTVTVIHWHFGSTEGSRAKDSAIAARLNGEIANE